MRIGILGGGQLARMTVQEGKRLGYDFVVLDPTPNCPAHQVGADQIVGDFRRAEDVEKLVSVVDVVTYDIEHVNTEKLKEVEIPVRPSPEILEIVKDKLRQKEFLKKNGIPIPKFVETLNDAVDELGFPFVQKLRYGGYDGRGVFVVRCREDLKNAFEKDYYVEEMVDIEKELAVLVARNVEGEMRVYPVVEMLFDERANICDVVLAPARIDEDVEERAKKIGLNTVKAFGDGAVGVFAIEMFLTKDGKVLVNEIAPRPHNSGHYTLDGCVTSQFEQHVRAIASMPLGSTELLSPTAMVNILGEGEGKPKVIGLKDVLKIDGVKVHFYGKSYVRPFRKMGHVNIVDRDINSLLRKVEIVKKTLRVVGV